MENEGANHAGEHVDRIASQPKLGRGGGTLEALERMVEVGGDELAATQLLELLLAEALQEPAKAEDRAGRVEADARVAELLHDCQRVLLVESSARAHPFGYPPEQSGQPLLLRGRIDHCKSVPGDAARGVREGSVIERIRQHLQLAVRR
ncbi:hypothetical protein [Polyangium aurulentum]|uniref:hypothetical protein n=1 Tax=Polyangium aurulentum TaxID=2567896 RepID=UPI00201019D9|nr:hypothetical protein [Polyangium aurulentum]UQA57416.1 hypothetical protein E8A73_040040 [Polyangium aurulentum]